MALLRTVLLSCSIMLPCAPAATQQAAAPAQGLAGDALRAALHDEAADLWIYDDLDAATARARESGKPLLVSFRCVP